MARHYAWRLGRFLQPDEFAGGPVDAFSSNDPLPHGALRSLHNGASIVATYYYNNRLQPCRISAKHSGTAPTNCADATNIGNIVDFSYNFDSDPAAGVQNNGNVGAIANNITTARSQSFSYDERNRIAMAKTQATTGQYCWGETFSYDPWGNLLTIGAITPDYNGCTQENLEVDVTVKNQIDGSCYDAAGNLALNTPCPQPPGTPITPVYTYDAENRMTATGGVTYSYDGDGRRVKKSNGTLYWYGTSGLDALLETDLAGNTPTEFVFFNGKRAARRDSSGSVFYYFKNHLGSANVVTNSAGTIVDESDYYPFGGERVVVNNDPNPYKFTGKERDSESGLDNFGARYFASSMGRFQTPDPYMPSADVKDPQSWNRYVYARNNPLRYIDPNGLDWSDLSGEQRRVFQTYADDYCKQNKEFCEKNKGEQLTEKIYGTLSQSQMATFESVTYALEHTQLVDSNGNSMGNALQQVAGVTSIAGEVPGASGDQQFRIFADLKPGAIETFAKAQGFEASSNKVLGLFQIYHKGFPDSFRQIRQEGVKGMEAGLQPSYNSSNRKADIDVDYRFGAAHLKPANSDVRAPGNYQKFIDRWPGLRNWWDK